MTALTDLQIARQADAAPIEQVAASMGIGPHLIESYGSGVAKIRLAAIDEVADQPRAKYVVVTAITPTPPGEGKTTTTVGLGDAFAHIGRRAVVAVRQPSMGPVFGINNKFPVFACGGDILSQCFRAVLKGPLGVEQYKRFNFTSTIHCWESCLPWHAILITEATEGISQHNV